MEWNTKMMWMDTDNLQSEPVSGSSLPRRSYAKAGSSPRRYIYLVKG